MGTMRITCTNVVETNETESCSDQQNLFHVIWELKYRTVLSKTNFVRMNWTDRVENTEVLHKSSQGGKKHSTYYKNEG
jgi:hypothetical protein